MDAACCNDDVCGDDCDDTLADVRPGVAEICNGRDDDCDFESDEPEDGPPLCPGGVCTAGACQLDAWIQTFGGAEVEEVFAVSMDRFAAVYAVGSFRGTASFDGGDLTASISAENQVVVAYDADGTPRWEHPLAGRFTSDPVIAADPDGSSVVVAGSFEQDLDLGDGTPFSRSGFHLFVAELGGADGSVLDSVVLPDVRARCSGVHFDGMNTVLVGDAFSGAIDGSVVEDGFLVALDPSLEVFDVRELTGAADTRALAARPSGGFVLVSAGFGAVDLGCPDSVGGADTESVFLAGFRSDLSCDWIFGLEGSVDFWDVTVDETGAVYASGDFFDSMDFGGGERRSESGQNGVILALSPLGAYDWDRTFHSPSSAELTGIAVTSDGVLAAGSFETRLSIGGATVGARSGTDSVVVELSRSGAYRGARTFESSEFDEAVDIAVGLGDSTTIVGGWSGSLTVDGTAYLSRMDGDGGFSRDVYVIRLSSS
ncbi:MAG TPA: putative metal-binding motif-containing protein [Sandaracinaceae bacterium LLY-WYZ-13_1]|nr:putative metal-binding motif-containing protein [Sandaracinaceae bacterium LLY-WYZ-13_1]